jgi:hypothetical protein
MASRSATAVRSLRADPPRRREAVPGRSRAAHAGAWRRPWPRRAGSRKRAPGWPCCRQSIGRRARRSDRRRSGPVLPPRAAGAGDRTAHAARRRGPARVPASLPATVFLRQKRCGRRQWPRHTQGPPRACKQLPPPAHRFPIVSGPLREVEKLFDEGPVRRQSMLTPPPVRGDGAAPRRSPVRRHRAKCVVSPARGLRGGAPLRVEPWVCRRVRAAGLRAGAKARAADGLAARLRSPAARGRGPVRTLRAGGACRPARDGCARAGTDQQPARREPGHRVPPAATRRDRDPRAGCAIGAPALRT